MDGPAAANMSGAKMMPCQRRAGTVMTFSPSLTQRTLSFTAPRTLCPPIRVVSHVVHSLEWVGIQGL